MIPRELELRTRLSSASSASASPALSQPSASNPSDAKADASSAAVAQGTCSPGQLVLEPPGSEPASASHVGTMGVPQMDSVTGLDSTILQSQASLKAARTAFIAERLHANYEFTLAERAILEDLRKDQQAGKAEQLLPLCAVSFCIAAKPVRLATSPGEIFDEKSLRSWWRAQPLRNDPLNRREVIGEPPSCEATRRFYAGSLFEHYQKSIISPAARADVARALNGAHPSSKWQHIEDGIIDDSVSALAINGNDLETAIHACSILRHCMGQYKDIGGPEYVALGTQATQRVLDAGSIAPMLVTLAQHSLSTEIARDVAWALVNLSGARVDEDYDQIAACEQMLQHEVVGVCTVAFVQHQLTPKVAQPLAFLLANLLAFQLTRPPARDAMLKVDVPAILLNYLDRIYRPNVALHQDVAISVGKVLYSLLLGANQAAAAAIVAERGVDILLGVLQAAPINSGVAFRCAGALVGLAALCPHVATQLRQFRASNPLLTQTLASSENFLIFPNAERISTACKAMIVDGCVALGIANAGDSWEDLRGVMLRYR